MDILERIGRLIESADEDEYDRLKKQLQAAKDRKANASTLDLIRDKLALVRKRIVTGHN